MKSKPPEFELHEIQAFEGLDLMKSKLRWLHFMKSKLRMLEFNEIQASGGVGFHEIQCPEAWTL